MKLVLFSFTAVCCSLFVQSVKKEIFKAAEELLGKEDKRLSGDKIKCSRQKITNNFISNLRLTGQVDQGIACVIAKLKSDNTNGHLWSTLGHFYQSKPKQYYASLSTTAFKQAVKFSGKLTAITDWSFLGPFVIGKIELDGDPVEEFGGIRKLSRLRFQKGQRMFSELLVGGHVEWTQIKQAGTDFIQISPKVQWGVLINALGSVGITEWQGWLVGDFVVNDKDVNALVQCLGVHTAFVDDIPVTGDVYRRSQFWYSTGPLSKGVHTLYIKVRTKGQAAVKCDIKQMTSSFEIHNPSFLPDLVNGYLFSNYISLPLSNQHSKKWLRNIKVVVSSQEDGQPLTIKTLDKLSIAPGQTRPVNLRLQAASQKVMEKCEDLSLKLKVSTSEGHNIFPLSLRCRKEGESFLFTFLDHDGSVQQAAAVHPIGGCLGNACPTVLTLHGTTVPPQNQADSYKRMENGKFVFGVDGAWLLAPTRHGAHNWEGPGCLTALTSLSRLSELTQEASWIQFQASERHVVYAGHSMGGHGAWHLATHYPDRALAVVSLSGWIKKEEYGDSNLFFRHDISTSHTDPAVKSVMEACIAENDADRHVSNLQDIPVLIRVGANDQTVHPFYQRRMYRLLKEHNISVTYTELDGKEHWWWDTWETNDGGTVNDKQVRDFVAQYTTIRDDVSSCSSDGECIEDVADRYKGRVAFTLTLYNPALGEGMRGVSVVQQMSPFRLTHVEVVVDGNSVVLVTNNVKALKLGTANNRPIKWIGKNITIDHQMVKTASVEVNELVLYKNNHGIWELEQDQKISSEERNLHTLGPARRVAEQPFLIVTGTQGDLETSATLQQLAVYIANLFYLTSDAYTPVVRDADIAEDMLNKHNLIIIGGPSQNKYAEQFLNTVPLLYNAKSGFQLGSCLYSRPKTGALFLSPHGPDHLALVLMAHSMHSLYDVVSLASPTIPPMTRSPFSNLIPDFILTGSQYRARGPGGYLCAGFWGNSWEFKAELASCSC